MRKLVIIGASGHGKVVADIAKKNGYTEICFLDDDKGLSECGGYPVVGISSELDKIEQDTFIAIGNTEIRQRLQERIVHSEKNVVTLVHPAAVIGENVSIGTGTVVMAGAVINPCAKIGNGCIINTCASVDHDCVVGDYAHISVGAHLAGTVQIGNKTWVGIGSVVSNNLSVCGECVIGAGAVVVKDIVDFGTYVGVPAVKMIERKA